MQIGSSEDSGKLEKEENCRRFMCGNVFFLLSGPLDAAFAPPVSFYFSPRPLVAGGRSPFALIACSHIPKPSWNI